jgi:hypothetical protein
MNFPNNLLLQVVFVDARPFVSLTTEGVLIAKIFYLFGVKKFFITLASLSGAAKKKASIIMGAFLFVFCDLMIMTRKVSRAKWQ